MPDRAPRLRLYFLVLVCTAAACLCATSWCQNTPPPILLGAAWYPEQWPETQWESDLSLMEKAGVHMVRVGEFAWSRMEPSEGHYDLDWLDRAVAAAGKHGIYTVLGTPTAAPPAWLTQKYPQTLRVDAESHRAEHGKIDQMVIAEPRDPIGKLVLQPRDDFPAAFEFHPVPLGVIEADRFDCWKARQRPGQAGRGILPTGE